MTRGILLVALFLAAGCKSKVECTSEVTAGNGTFKGHADGKPDEIATRRASVQDACRQMCGSTKAELVEACASKCAVDAEVGKIGSKTTCSGK